MNFAFKNPYTGKVGNVVASLGTSQVGMGTSQIAQPQMGSVNAVEETETDKGGNSTIKLEKPFAGLQFVLSGIENPERADVREKIIALGGEYSGSWTRRSTHLVSAYRKTPKIDQMIASGHGLAVFTQFVHECFSEQRRLSEADYLIYDCNSVEEIDPCDNQQQQIQQWDEGKLYVLPDFFLDLTFAIDSNSLTDELLKKKVIRYIFAYGGEVVSLGDLSQQTHSGNDILYIVCGDTAPITHSRTSMNLQYVHYSWVLITNELQKKISIEDFIIHLPIKNIN